MGNPTPVFGACGVRLLATPRILQEKSIKRFHLLDALTSVGDLFQRFGGHAQAAGFALAVERIPELTRRFEEHARNILTPSDLEPVLRVDAPIDLAEVDWPLYREIIQLEALRHGESHPGVRHSGYRWSPHHASCRRSI